MSNRVCNNCRKIFHHSPVYEYREIVDAEQGRLIYACSELCAEVMRRDPKQFIEEMKKRESEREAENIFLFKVNHILNRRSNHVY